MALERLQLDGKVAIVTGGARGVGRGIAGVLAEAGAAVVLTARTQTDVDQAVVEIKQAGGNAVGIAGDVTKDADNQTLIAKAIDSFGGIDILINNAGGSMPAPFFETTTEKFATDFYFNVIQAFRITQLAAPHMMEREGGGSVVNISSRSAQVGGKGFTTYSVSKAGLEQLSHMMAQELAPKIRVNTISLGTIMSDGLRNYLESSESARDNIQSKVPLQRVGDPRDIGLAALYLCSRECYATGTTIRVDGGITSSMA